MIMNNFISGTLCAPSQLFYLDRRTKMKKLVKTLIAAGVISLPLVSVSAPAYAAEDAEKAQMKAEMESLKARLATLEEKLDEKEKAPASGTIPTMGEMLDASGIQIHGHVDVTYTDLSGGGKFINGANDRVFDYEPDSFNLQAVDITVSKQPTEGFGALVNITAGKDADVIAAFDTDGLYNGEKDNFDVTQAFVHYAHGPYTVMAGKFLSLVGYEVINAANDVNISRNILINWAQPYTHTGVRVAYKPNDTLTLYAGLNNGWDLVKDTNGSKTLELGAGWMPDPRFMLGVYGYNGRERVGGFVTSGPQGDRTLIDVVATFNATDNLQFALNYDHGEQENGSAFTAGDDADWDGVAGYINYKFHDKWRLSLRGEWFDDKDGYRTGAFEPGATDGQEWKEATATLSYFANDNVELRGEVRRDWSDQDVFLDSNEVDPEDDQTSIEFQALYKF
jgi:hypothetical protein